MAASLMTLRPMFATYYGSLDDEQKARPKDDHEGV
jgi:hypothetical protein